ncbi:hypothetical protein HYC85_012628 [Camellia sinensis]|uniref:Uncharacterized protein n=1 Tax=Camellia sinensis TaxID=4442 RepID=A0A7J7HDD4_CAMSI|nr:hypothetical protein HYC85_012628 [Camellia sinensis]
MFNTIMCRLACKEISIGGYRGWRLKILEAFIIILTFTELLYLFLIHAGVFSSRYGPGLLRHHHWLQRMNTGH